jgi:hypothetical protein
MWGQSKQDRVGALDRQRHQSRSSMSGIDKSGDRCCLVRSNRDRGSVKLHKRYCQI